jgi:hypothetical protein
VKIFVQELQSGTYFAGGQKWTLNPADAYAFSSGLSALNFCYQLEKEQPRSRFIMRFERPDGNRSLSIAEMELSATASQKNFR